MPPPLPAQALREEIAGHLRSRMQDHPRSGSQICSEALWQTRSHGDVEPTAPTLAHHSGRAALSAGDAVWEPSCEGREFR
eukprot:CAMPEP_0194529528 /NCGR_PEP_ID=MMETSP0253-20130528/66256_1 /TAXON_ID=2966 /ORGANISM="Noctiluca scintillans" /LENGTH=79 /DNA_ID=CAMNT_0039374673 /DNA_START=97 /DNA_END=333 /DNA_ORIENTATION=-